MGDIFKLIGEKGIVPVINIENPEQAVPLAAALTAGGLPLIEVTLRNDTSLQSVEAIQRNCPQMAVAAGTVLSPEMAKEAAAAGAELVVTPGFQKKTVEYCLENDIAVMPGCVTASDITTAVEMGLHNLKFFPAEQGGGVKAMELLGGPFGQVKFIPTGGISLDNLETYLRSKKILACGGSFMAKPEDIRQENWAAITAKCRRAMDLSLGFQLAHVGINYNDEEDARKSCHLLCRLLRLPVDERSKSVFAGSCVENMKFPYYGEKGHIGFRTNSLLRAMAYLEESGVEFREESRQFDKKGNLTCVYLKEEIAGFAIHLV